MRGPTPKLPPVAGPRAVQPVRAAAPGGAEQVMRTCPVCGSELAERKCKLYCPRPGCSYFLSCADYY